MPGVGQHDRYFLNSVEMHTGYLLSDIKDGKKVIYVLPKLTAQIIRFKELMGKKVKKIGFNKDKEFMGAVNPMLDKKKYEEC